MTTALELSLMLGVSLLVALVMLRLFDEQPAPAAYVDGGEYNPPPEDTAPTDDTATQLPTAWDSFAAGASNPWAIFAIGDATTGGGAADANLRACLDMISYAEGTNRYPDNGYRTMFGGRQCVTLADHPRQRWTFTNSRGQTLTTTAAGRYQFLQGTWDELARKLQLPDFGPDSQDRACIELIRQRGALDDARAGRVVSFVARCAKTWASLPGAGYAQPERKLSTLLAAYEQAGGTLTT